MKIAVLFDGAGLARLGLEQAGHETTGFELDPWKHYLGQFVGSGNTILADVRDVDLTQFDAVWASPPCQITSQARTQGPPISCFATDLLQWSLSLPNEVLWVENVLGRRKEQNNWGRLWNAAQFTETPLQSRNRIIGGRYLAPNVYREYQKYYKGVCPTILASEYKGCATDPRRASRFYGRRLTIHEAAYHQGFTIPEQWLNIPFAWTGKKSEWWYNIYEAIGNGVPTYMAKAFGEVYNVAE